MGMSQEDEYNEYHEPGDEDLSPEELLKRMDTATKESARLHKLYIKALQEEHKRVPDPGWDNFTFDVRFRGNRTTYHFTARRMPNGSIYTTGTSDGYFPSWAAFVRWLRKDDKTYVSNLTKLALTDLVAVVR